MRVLLAALVLLGLGVSPAYAGEDVELIESLLTAVGDSGCTFIRNGKEHSADNAENHLRMKYRRGKKYVSSVETFIERIATKSSRSGKPYRIRCTGSEAIPTAEWLKGKLDEIRSEAATPKDP